jgi:hypothetical protein
MCKHYHPAEEVPMFSFAQMLGNRIRPRRSSSAKSRKTRLQVEALEERAVPTVVIVPQFGPETIAPGSTNDGMQHPAVNLIFSGKYWNTIEGQQDETTLLNSVQSILSGPYLSRLTQYGSDGKANLGKARAQVRRACRTSSTPPSAVTMLIPACSTIGSTHPFTWSSLILHRPEVMMTAGMPGVRIGNGVSSPSKCI